MALKEMLYEILHIKSVLSYIDIRCTKYRESMKEIDKLSKDYSNKIVEINNSLQKKEKDISKLDNYIFECKNLLKANTKKIEDLTLQKKSFESDTMDYKVMNNIDKEEFRNLIIENIEHNIQFLNNTLEVINDNISKTENLKNRALESNDRIINSRNEFIMKMDIILDSKKKICEIEKEKINLIYNELCNKTKSFIHYKDYDKLEYIYYFLETGRADTIKEALNLVDTQLRHEELIEVMGVALSTVCRVVQHNTEILKQSIENSTYNICSKLEMGFQSLDSSLVSVCNKLESVNYRLDQIYTQNTEIIDSNNLTNSLLKDQNETCENMLDNYRYVNGLSGDL